MRLRAAFIIVVVLLAGCTQKKVRTIDFTEDRDFRIINVFHQQKYEDLKKRLPDMIAPDKEISEPYAAYSYLSLKPDDTYTLLLGNQFMYGTYTVVNKDEVVLKSEEFGEMPLKILGEQGNAIQVFGDFKKFKSDFMVEINGRTGYYLNLKSDFKKLGKENDIRSLSFNEWRFRPAHKESDEEIKKRLVQNLNYMTAYMRVYLYGDFEKIYTQGIHSPFFYAKNSLVLLEWSYVPYFWKHMFFDEKDSEKAYKILKRAFAVTESPEYTDNWLAYNERCIQKVIATIENME